MAQKITCFLCLQHLICSTTLAQSDHSIAMRPFIEKGLRYPMSQMRNVHDTQMSSVPGSYLSRAWFLASTRKLESLIPFLSDEEADKVCRELNNREDQQDANRGVMNGVPPQF